MSTELIRVSAAATRTGLSAQTIRNYIRLGMLTGHRVGKLQMVDSNEVNALHSIQEHE